MDRPHPKPRAFAVAVGLFGAVAGPASASDCDTVYAVFKALNVLKNNPTFDSYMRDIGIIADKTIVCDGGGLPAIRREVARARLACPA